MLAIMLMLQLRSLSRAILVLITGPLGIIGAVFTLILLGRPLGFVSFLGIIAMNGMIIRNAVILLDQIEQDIANGVPAFDAVVDSAVRRARPIMPTTVTTVTTVLAMIPLTNTSFWGPMAVAIMGRSVGGHRTDTTEPAGHVFGLVPYKAHARVTALRPGGE